MSDFEFHATYSAVSGEYVGGYVPHVEHDTAYDFRADGTDVLFDGNPDNLSEWSAITGKTRQHGYRGAIMHPAETADDDAVREWVREAGGDLFALVEVDGCEHDGAPHDECTCVDCDNAIYCQEYGCPTPPMGWAIIFQPAE